MAHKVRDGWGREHKDEAQSVFGGRTERAVLLSPLRYVIMSIQ